MPCYDNKFFQLYLDRELAPDLEREAASHFKTCARCSEFLDRCRVENLEVKRLFSAKLDPPDLSSAVLERLPEATSDTDAVGIRWPGPIMRRWAFGAVGILFLAALLFLFVPGGETGDKRAEREVLVQRAMVEGRSANSHVFVDKESGIKFIWLEKI